MINLHQVMEKIKKKQTLSLGILFFLLLTLTGTVYYSKNMGFDIRKKASEPTTTGQVVRPKDFSTILPTEITSPIYGLKISGNVDFTREDSFIRVILIDKDKNEYLVYESYPLIATSKSFSVTDECVETCILNSITPVNLRIEGNSASFNLTKSEYINTIEKLGLQVMDLGIDREREKEINKKHDINIKRLNEKIKEKGLEWKAGETSVSRLSYQEKRKLFPKLDHLPNLGGFEYYTGGIFEIPSVSSVTASSTSLYPASWDWRNRHGQNWMTPVRDQGYCNGCWAFAPVAAIEADTNLYINEHFNFNMSEQDLLSCSGAGDCEKGGYQESALLFIQNNGIVDQSCFLNQGGGIPCQRCSDWQNRYYKIAGFGVFIPKNEDEIKNRIAQKGVLSGGIYSWNHVMGLLGWQTDVDNTTIWIFKNSWGATWGENGYGKIKVSLEDMYPPSFINTPILVNGLTIPPSCRDADVDGYCFWGISDTRPVTCSQSCAELPDCDDSNPSLQVFDQYYNCRPFDPLITPPNPETTPTSPSPITTPTFTPTPTTILTPIPYPTRDPNSYRVFVTSQTYTGNLGGLSGADTKCQERADAAQLGGTWKAWLSDTTTSAASRLIHSNIPYKRIDGVMVATSWNDLTDGSLFAPINRTDINTTIDDRVWTCTTINGSICPQGGGIPNRNCNDWTYSESSNSSWGDHGYTTSNSEWTYGLGWTCDSHYRLYCFEQTLLPAPSLSPALTPTPGPIVCPTGVPPNTIPSHDSGNANCDSKIDIIDFNIWWKETTGQLTTTTADFNGVGGVNIIDFNIWWKTITGQNPTITP